MDYHIEARCPTHRAEIYVGLREGYRSEVVHPLADVEAVCRTWVEQHGFAVTVTSTTIFGRSCEEPAAVVGLVRNPRFRPELEDAQLDLAAIRLAGRLVVALHQERVHVVTDGETIVIRSETVEADR